MPNDLLSLGELRDRIDRAHEKAVSLMAEAEWLRLKSCELVDRITRQRENGAPCP